MPNSSITARDRRRWSPANLYGRGISSKTQIISVTDLLCEGPIEGLADPQHSVFLDGDPIEDIGAEAPFYDRDVTFSASTGANQAVGMSNEKIINHMDTTDDSDHHRFIFVFDATTRITGTLESYTTGALRIKASSGTPFKNSWISDSATYGNGSLHCRIFRTEEDGTTQYAEYYMNKIFAADGTTTVTDNGTQALFNAKNMGVRPFNEEDANNKVTVEIVFDLALSAEVKVNNDGNKYLEVDNNHTNAFSFTNKKASISGAMVDGYEKKVKDSTVQFRPGTETQAPLKQLAGIGTSSISVTLSDSDKNPWSISGSNWKSDNTNTTNNAYLREEFYTLASKDPHTETFKDDHDVGSSTSEVQHNRITLLTKSITLSNQGMAESQIAEVDELRVQFRYPGGLNHLDGGGNLDNQSVGHQIHVYFQKDGVWQVKEGTFFNSGGLVDTGRTRTAFSKDHIISVSSYQPFEDICIQVTRLTPTGMDNPIGGDKYEATSNAGNGKVQLLRNSDKNNTGVTDISQLSAINCIIKETLNYPLTALGACTFNSRDYSSNPTRTYDLKGKLVKIPSNYTPRHLVTDKKTAEYDGLWDGTFKSDLVYTDNPAWVFYDMLTNDRYGLGSFLDEVDIDKYALYKIAKYCDELVPDGNGDTEPRFRANIYLTKATDCYKVLKDMSTVFMGILYWLDGQMVTVQDAPAAPVYNFGPSNIIDGDIKTETTGSKTRANQIIVTWNNPASQYRLEPLIVEDRQNILETGRVIKEEAQAFGCTSEGQAVRYGKWKLWTAVNQKEIISFQTGLNAGFLQPGDIINVQQPDNYGIHFSGRVSAHSVVDSSTNSQLTLDRNISLESGGVQADGGGEDIASYTFSSSSTYSIAALVNHRKVILAQDTVTIGSTTYSRGDEIQTVFLPTGSNNAYQSATINLDQTDEKVRGEIVQARDAATVNGVPGNAILLQFVSDTHIEALPFTSSNVSVSNGKTVIKCTGKFSGNVVISDSIWAIKEQKSNATQAYSYKEYKILGISEEDTGNLGITAVEFYNSKFDAVDREFELDIAETIYTPEETTCPAPPNVYVLRVPVPDKIGEEVLVQWDRPLDADGNVYDKVTRYEVQFIPNFNNTIYTIEEAGAPPELHMKQEPVPDGTYKVGVRAVTSERKSKWTHTKVQIQDTYGSYTGARIAGAAIGVQANFDEHAISSSTFKLMKKAWKMRSVANLFEGSLANPATGTAATHSQELASMAYTNSTFPAIEEAHILFDQTTTSNDYLRLAAVANIVFENSIIETWYDRTEFAPNNSGGVENNRWTHVDCNISVPAETKTNRVTRTGGSTGFTSAFQIGDIIRVKSGSKFYAAKVALIESDDLLFTDMQLNSTNTAFAITANSTNKTVARQSFRLDPLKDGILATITRNGSNYSAVNHLQINVAFTGRAVTARFKPIQILNYNSDASLNSTWTDKIELEATALNYIEPIFKVTGNFASNANPNNSTEAGKADSSFKDPDTSGGAIYTKIIHNADESTHPIAYTDPSSAAPQVFTVAVREAEEPDTTWETFTTISLEKIKQGEQGINGTSGNKTVQGYLYYEKQTTPGTPPGAPSEATYTFSTGKINAGGSGATAVVHTSAVDKWMNEPRTQDPASSNIHYTVRYFGEAAADATTVEVTYSNVVRYTNFSGVVTFDSGTNLLKNAAGDITTIDGGSITTGILRSPNTILTENDDNPIGTAFATSSGGSAAPAYFNLSTGAIATKNFKVDSSGNAEFKGTIRASSGYIGPSSATGWNITGSHLNGGGTHWAPNTGAGETYANITMDSHMQRILIRDDSQNQRVILGWLGSGTPG